MRHAAKSAPFYSGLLATYRNGPVSLNVIHLNNPSQIFEADKLLQQALEKHSIDLGLLIAETGLWASPAVHHHLEKENGSGAWRPNVRRARAGEVRRSVTEGVLLDDNTFANTYIKAAIGLSRGQVIGYETCHVWPLTCYHPAHHTTIANLVLLPRALAGVTDHNKQVRSVLQYRSYELYGFYPAEVDEPTKPPQYPTSWLAPMPFNERVKRSLLARPWAAHHQSFQPTGLAFGEPGG